jgi:aspartyl protease family protein
MRRFGALLAAALWLAPQVAAAQGVVLAGRMGERALLMVDGQPRTLAAGQSAADVRFVGWQDDSAVIERDGARYLLRMGASAPTRLAGAAAASGGREIVITAGPGGHFITPGSINGRSVRFMVDTGATVLALGRDEALRLGLDLSTARAALSETANGTVQVQMITLTRVRVGDVEVANVPAMVVPATMPYVLLGNSFLTRFQMRRENDVMRLEQR